MNRRIDSQSSKSYNTRMMALALAAAPLIAAVTLSPFNSNRSGQVCDVRMSSLRTWECPATSRHFCPRSAADFDQSDGAMMLKRRVSLPST